MWVIMLPFLPKNMIAQTTNSGDISYMLNKYVLFIIMIFLSLFGLLLPKLKEILNNSYKNFDIGILGYHIFTFVVSIYLIIQSF